MRSAPARTAIAAATVALCACAPAAASAATVTLDRACYEASPAGIVTITGAGFTPGEQYTVLVQGGVVDVGNAAEAEGAMNDLLGRLERIDVLVNNAGVTADGLFLMMPRKDWNAVIDTTLHGFYNMTKPVLRKMLRRKSGSIVSLSSVSALVGNRGQANYAAAKAGLIAASRVLSSEVARLGIRVNVVAPGPVDTDMIRDAPLENIKQMIPMGRIGRPEEVAKVVRFLCSDDASYITGQVISVNGGMF